MIALCFNCGTTKERPLQACPACQHVPMTDNDIAVSALLTDQTLSAADMTETAQSISEGERIVLPDETRIAVLRSLFPRQGAIRARPRRGIVFWTWMLVLASAVAAFFAYHPWPHYQWAALRDTDEAYTEFLERFDGTDHADTAKERLRKMREDGVWQKAATSGDYTDLRNYERIYSYDGKYLAEAKAALAKVADQQWLQLANSRSEPELQAFLAKFPETTNREAALTRIQQLHDDWDWVREQDKLEHYRAFASRFPQHAEAAWLEKRIIDLEVQAIAAGEFGTIPNPEPVTIGGTMAQLEVKNDTGYTLTLLYSGRESRRLVVPVGATGTLELAPGDYHVAASVAAANVTNYYGTQSLQGAHYGSSFYISQTMTRSPFGLPGSGRTKRR
jgi:hypothetical protein